MSRPNRLRLSLAACTAALTVAGVAGFAASQSPPLPAHPVIGFTAATLLSQPIPDTTPDAPQVRRGQYLVAVGDCMSCHLREGGEPLAGGLGLKTPFGVIYSPNITSDQQTGIGAWTGDQFYRAMHDGVGVHGENLYPALPYPWFTHASRQDDDAILAYLKTTAPVHYTAPANRLPFPLNIRFLVKGWNLLFFRPATPTTDPNQSAEWNRGAYIVNGYGHCGACHTPKNLLGADKSRQYLRGGVLDNWTAPNLTGAPRIGLGGWSVDDIAEYLRTGRNLKAGAGGSMGEVITYSTSLMSEQDRHAIAVYLKSQAASPEPTPAAPDADAMRRGAAIYSDACASCHLENGVGQPRYFPPLGHDAMLQQTDAAGLEHLILAGGRVGTSPTLSSPLTMPTFAWKLTDGEIADVATYIRNSWGNRAAPLSAAKVHEMRRSLDLEKVHLTVNSGDHG